MDVTSIAFIKGKNGYLIDSIALSTSLDTLPYAFSFPGDTLFLDVSILNPVDELTITTFAQGHSFGPQACWVDGPSADVHLSIASGKSVVDSVSLSPIETWFRKELLMLVAIQDPDQTKIALEETIFNSLDILPSATFLKVYLNMPNLDQEGLRNFYYDLYQDIGYIRRHPSYQPLLAKLRLLGSGAGKLSKYEVFLPDGKATSIKPSGTDYYVLNFYDAKTASIREEHQAIQASLQTDSLFIKVPIISITNHQDVDAWQQYVQEGEFRWPHYREAAGLPNSRTEKLAFYPGTTYVLINRRNRIEGVYKNLQQLVSAVLWRQKKH